MTQYQNCTLRGIGKLYMLRKLQKRTHFGQNRGPKYKILILPKIWPFLQLQEPLQPIYALQIAHLVLFCLWNHFFCPFMDLQCSKWHIGLKIEDFVFFTSILPKMLPFLHLFELSYPIYGLHSTVLVLFHLHNHFVSPFMDLQCFNWKFVLKIDDFVFLPPFCPKFGPFCNFQTLYNLFMPCKVHFWYCFVCATTFSVLLWIYSIPNGKLTLKLKILYFWPLFCPKIWPILQHSEPLHPSYAFQSTVLVLCPLCNHFLCPFMDLRCYKWQICLKIVNFVFLTSILPKIGPFWHLLEPPYPIYGLQSVVLVLLH